MTPERWRRIEALYHSALERDPGARATFLDQACGQDADLRREVESLLAEASTGQGVLDRPMADLLAESGTTGLKPGTRLGSYQIEGLAGQGGMGKVYRARDTRLGRTVAIKTSSARFSERFEREARAAAALNHEHICHLYHVGPDYLVLEYIEGTPVKGPLPFEEALKYAIQICDALDAAHRAGIVHRDLKPGNILLSKQGIKLLDFGLAQMEAAPDDPSLTQLTQTGALMGTPAYMAPEQWEGKRADARSDIYSFGCVLYEMLTGQRVVVNEAKGGRAAVAAPLEDILRTCLEKDPDERWQSARELKHALRWAAEAKQASPAPSLAKARVRSRFGRAGWIAAVAIPTVLLAALAFVHFAEKPRAPMAPVRFEIVVPAGFKQLSPDGRKLAICAGGRLRVHSLESGESRDLTAADDAAPFWSPDSRFIGYLSQGKLKKIEVTGGPPQTLVDLASNYLWGGGAWNQNDVMVIGDRRVGLFRVPASSGVPVQITSLYPTRHEVTQFSPSFLPDGRHFVYPRGSTDEGKSAIYLGSVDAKPEQQSSRPLVASSSQAVYAPSAEPGGGYLLFIRGGTLMAQPFDDRRFELKGQAKPVAEQVTVNLAGVAYVDFSASANDVLAFPRAGVPGQLTWYDREGEVMGTVGEPFIGGNLALSPDGTRLAVKKLSGGADASNLWLLDLSRGGASTRFTFGSRVDYNPVWSPDGSRIIYSSNRDGPYNLYQKPANGVKDDEVLLKSSEDKLATSWSRDGRFLLYTVVHPKTRDDIWVLPLDNDKKPVPFLITDFNEEQARFSPDGHWVAYTSDESGQDEIYVRSFSMNAAGTTVEASGKWPVSNGPGTEPRWRGDGRELYYRSRDGKIMAVEIAANPAFRAGIPHPLGHLISAFWDSAANGRRFVSLTNTNGPKPYTVVLNWQALLKK